ncbi:hypothetical protein DFH27DRAFT_523259 [Peziza echinospora]|nr:hypothetical protein DFH27DRAFT_523259 [Peziza echinospora]
MPACPARLPPSFLRLSCSCAGIAALMHNLAIAPDPFPLRLLGRLHGSARRLHTPAANRDAVLVIRELLHARRWEGGEVVILWALELECSCGREEAAFVFRRGGGHDSESGLTSLCLSSHAFSSSRLPQWMEGCHGHVNQVSSRDPRKNIHILDRPQRQKLPFAAMIDVSELEVNVGMHSAYC